MELYNHDNGSGIFIQIGAGAGDLDKRANCRDGFTEFIKNLPRNRIKQIILVEPNPLNIPLLKECWKDYPETVIYEIGNNCELEKFVINIKCLEDFITIATKEEIELLALDIEGIDAEVILDLDFNNMNLKYLSFEHLHLEDKRNDVLQHLDNHNFRFLGNGIDHNGFDYLYVNKFK